MIGHKLLFECMVVYDTNSKMLFRRTFFDYTA